MPRLLTPPLHWARFLATSLALVSSPGHAAEAVFSADGERIYFPPIDSETGLAQLELSTGTRSPAPLPTNITHAAIQSLSRQVNGEILLATADAVWAWRPEQEEARMIHQAPAGIRFDEVACDPVTGGTLITTVNEDEPGDDRWGALWASPEQDGQAVKVFIRRVRYLESPTFDHDGQLLFTTEGDIWWGRIGVLQMGPDEEDMPFLAAIRYAPVATRETDPNTPSQTGARELAVAHGSLWAHVKRMGGSGWGNVIRLNRPPAIPGKKEPVEAYFELTDRIRLYLEALQSVESITENGTRSLLCSSPDGETVFFRDAERFWIARDGGRAKPVPVPRTP